MSNRELSRRAFLQRSAAGAVGAAAGLSACPSKAAAKKAPVFPELRSWEEQMVTFGKKHGEFLAEGGDELDPLLFATYYDAQRVFLQIGDYTKDDIWIEYAQHACNVYRDRYVLPNEGKIPGYWIFPHGLAMDFKRRGAAKSRQAVILLSQFAAFAPDTTPIEETAQPGLSREVAYNIMTMLKAEEVGAKPRKRLSVLIEQALGHYDQWFISETAPYVQPFMAGLTAEALIGCYEKAKEPRIVQTLKSGLDWLWANAWLADASAFRYCTKPIDEQGTKPASDLNLLIAPAYAWIYHKTGDAAYRDKADDIFAGGVRNAWLDGPKQFNQNYRWSFDYIRWRSAEPSVE